jgi:hypothetical protein
MDKTIYLLITLLMYIFSSYIIFWYGHRLFEFKKDAKTSFTICLASNMLLWILLVSFSTFIVNIPATIILFFIVFYFAFNCDLKLSIFNSLLLVAIMNISEYIVLFLVSSLLNLELNHYENNLITFAEEAFASKILYFGLLAIISSFSKKSNGKEGFNSSIFLTILPTTILFVTVVFRFQSIYFKATTLSNILFLISEILMFATTIVVFTVHERAIDNQKKIHDMEMVEQKQAINLEYLDILERKDEETRIFVHDIRNNLINISNLTDEENVKKYIQEIYDKSNEISVKAKTKNRLLDVIINKYYLLCKDKNIKFSILSLNENLSFINDYDISAILDNLLRNAIEGAEKEKNPYISLSLESDNKFHKIILKNSCSTKPIEDKNNLITTKSNKNIHGYGMKSILKALNNYNGELEWAYNNNEFKIIILIPA